MSQELIKYIKLVVYDIISVSRTCYEARNDRTHKKIETSFFNEKYHFYGNDEVQNDKKKFANLTYNNKSKKFDIDGSSYNGEASNRSVVGNWWSHKILQADTQISPVSGSVKEQVVTFLGKEKINLYGKIYNVDHFTLKSKDMSLPKDKRLDFDIWYDPENFIIKKISYTRMGLWEYHLKNIE